MTNYFINNAVNQIGFNTNTTFNISMPSGDANYRNVICVAVQGNGNVFNVFDIVFINNKNIVKVLHLGDSNNWVKYAISGNNIVVSCSTNWSYGMYIKVD